MRKLYCLVLICASVWSAESMGQSAFVNQGVIEKMSQANENELIPILIQLEEKVDIDALKASFILENTPVSRRPQLVNQALASVADETQPAIISAIENSGLSHADVKGYWICNAIELKAVPALIEMLSYREDIAQITLNLPIFGLNNPVERVAGEAKTVGGHEIGLEAIGAPEMWALGYTGHGRMALTFDTGVQPDHPAHRDRFLANLLPLESTWFPYDSPIPTDKSNSHGTHVTGTILGLDTLTNDTIGVAPQAYFIATDPIVQDIANVQTLSALMLGYQWALNPDGDWDTSNDVPDVINNSWGRSNDIAEAEWQLCSDAVADVMNAVLAAGISNVFSAGNEGPDPSTIGIPHNINTGLVNSFTVAAVSGSGDHTVAEFSSRGPSMCGGEGSILIKPEVSAPGINVRSSVQHDEYAFYSGTSMAAPHTSGAVLLLKEAFPYLSGEELQLALYFSAIDLGDEGEDNTYGMGLINVYEAYLYLSENNTPVPPLNLETDLVLMSIDAPSFDFGCTVNGEGEITPIVTVKNVGINPVEAYSISYSINGGAQGTFGVDQAIAPGEEVQITLAPVSYSVQGMVEFHVMIDEIEGEYDVWNNNRTIRWQQLNEFDLASNGAFTEDFANGLDENVWIVQNPDESVTWDVAEVLQIDGTTGTAAWMDHPGYGIIESQKDKLVSPLMTGNTDQQVLTFDYFYRKRSNAAFTQDTLTIYINNDCSPADIQLWQAGGSELWTNDQNQTNALPETIEDWSTVSIDLPTEMAEEFYVIFESRNRRGNNLLIDNINISGSNSLADKAIDLDFEIYPNPATDLVLIKPNAALKANEVRVMDTSGRMIFEDTMDRTTYNFDISSLAPGAYLVFITYQNDQQHAEKLIVE